MEKEAVKDVPVEKLVERVIHNEVPNIVENAYAGLFQEDTIATWRRLGLWPPRTMDSSSRLDILR